MARAYSYVPSFFYLTFLFKFKAIVEEAILSEDNHVCAGDLLIIYVKWATSGSDIPVLERGSFHLNLLSVGF